MGRGQLIVLEGVDGSGTSTQASRLFEALRARDYPVHLTREPSDGPVGVLIRQILTRRVVVPGRTGPRPPRMETMALLFAADRIDHLESEMLPNLGDGINIICDRYVHSSIAYQSLTAGVQDEEAYDWVTTVNSRARPPELVIVLDVPPEAAAERRKHRGGAEEMYEDELLQRRLCEFYAQLPERFPELSIELVDGALPVDQVHQRCLDLTLNQLQAGRR